MRSTFMRALTELAAEDERVVLLTGDLGWGTIERFAARFPGRFLNVGVAEQNMAGLASGMARDGLVPYIYSIATFATMRCYEQFRNGAALHNLPVRLIGIGGGFSYGHAGPTHYALEDLAILRTQPSVAVIAPADAAQARAVLRSMAGHSGPVYFRVDKNERPDLAGLAGRFALGRPERIRTGVDVLLLSTGSITYEVLKAAELLAAAGPSAAVAVMAHLPFEPSADLVELLSGYPAVITVEEASTAGGLGSLVAESIARAGLRCRLVPLGVSRPLPSASGSTAYMRRLAGLSPESIAQEAAALIRRRAVA
jgi:transketolase